jgi:hypothetical protein
VAWADTHQGVWRDGYFPGNVRTENGFEIDYGNVKSHYDVVLPALADAYDLAPEEIEPHVFEVRRYVSEDADVLESFGWNYYDAISAGALELSVDASTEQARWMTPIEGLAEWWCWEDPGLRGPD